MDTSTSGLIRFLRWSERYTKTDMVYLAKGGSWLLLGNAVIVLLSFGVLYAFANFIPQQVYGEYRFVISIFEILYITTLSGLGTSLSQAVASGFDGNFRQIMFTRLRYGLVGSVISLCIGAYYLLNDNDALGFLFLSLAIAVPLFPSSQLYTNYLLGKKNFRAQSLYSIYARFATAIAMIAILYLTSNLILILIVFFVSNIGINLFLTWRTLLKEPPNQNSKPDAISFGKHVSVVETCAVISSNIDKIVVWKFLGPVQLASFLIALAIPQELITRIIGIFSMLAFPKFGENAAMRPIDILQKLVRISLLMGVFVAFYVAIVPLLFTGFFPQYVSMAPYAQALSLILIFAPFTMITTYFSARQMTRKLYIAAIGDLIIKVSLFLPLVYLYGIEGAVAATVGFFLLKAILCVHLLLSKSR